MELPTQTEITEALEWYLAEHGPCEMADAVEALADKFDLSAAQRHFQPAERAQPVWTNKVCWARQRLKNMGRLAKTERGVWDLKREQEVGPLAHQPNPLVKQVAA